MFRHNKFGTLNKLKTVRSTGMLNKLKITRSTGTLYGYVEQIENNNYDFFCKATLQYFQSKLEYYVLTGRFKLSCYCNIHQYSVIITVDAEDATINARSTKFCL